jgi:hypothetical protein
MINCRLKLKFTLEQAMKAQMGNRGATLRFLYPLHQMGGGGVSTPCPSCITSGKETWYPLYKKLGGPQGWSGWMWKISSLPGLDLQTIQPIASRYTNYAVLNKLQIVVKNAWLERNVMKWYI